MNQISLGLDLGMRLRDRAWDLMEEAGGDWVDGMRHIAKTICRRDGQVTSDDLQRIANRTGLQPPHGNYWGAIFRGNAWRCVGRKRSEIPSNHAREIRIWQWREHE